MKLFGKDYEVRIEVDPHASEGQYETRAVKTARHPALRGLYYRSMLGDVDESEQEAMARLHTLVSWLEARARWSGGH